MDESFNGNKLPYGWFAEGWVVKDSVAQRSSQKQSSESENPESGTPEFSMPSMMGGDDSYNYLMTPPLSVKKDEVLSFSAKKGGGDGNALGSFMGDSDSTLVVERAVYGQFTWIKVADFTTEIDSTYKTFTISDTNPGEYRFRFRAGGSVVIDSVAGFHIDTKAPDLYPVYKNKNVKPVDLGLCDKDTTITFSVVNTGTDTLNVSLSLDNKIYTLDLNKASVAAADTAKFKLTFNFEQAREGRNSVKLTFAASGRNIEKVPLPIDAVVTQENVYVQDFNTTEMPFAWFSEGWEMKENTASVSKVPESMGPLASSNESYFLMTPPLKVRNDKDVLLFSVKKPGGDGGGFDMSSLFGGGDEGNKLIVEKSVYGSNKWEKSNRPQNPLEIVYKGVLRDFSPLFPCQFQ